MVMEVDEDDVWGAVATSPSSSPPPVPISTALSLHLLAASGGIVGGAGSPFLPSVAVGSPFHPGGGCYRNAAASPSSSSFFSAAAATAASSFPRLAPLEREMCHGPAAAAASWTAANASGGVVVGGGGGGGGPVERRKKRMINNRESASRSRARKQAHVAQIETELKELREANDQLRLKYDQLKATVEVSVPVKKTLQRVLSAPF